MRRFSLVYARMEINSQNESSINAPSAWNLPFLKSPRINKPSVLVFLLRTTPKLRCLKQQLFT